MIIASGRDLLLVWRWKLTGRDDGPDAWGEQASAAEPSLRFHGRRQCAPRFADCRAPEQACIIDRIPT